MPEKCDILEELRWMPGLADCDLKMYLRAARSMAAFAGMCDGGSAEDGCLAASRDDTTINALQLLHESHYDTGKALQALVKSPVPKGIEKKWTEEEQKRFVKGLRLYGKNFFKIRKELLSHKETPDLVEYYYLWKKTPQAASARPHRRHRRCVLRRIRNSSNNANSNSQSKANPNNKEDGSSASDDDVEQSDDSDLNANADLTCSNCGTLAKELRQTGNDRSLLCKDCRTYLKTHGKHRPTLGDKDTKLIKNEDDSNLSNGKPNLRVRKGKEKGSKSELHRGNSKSSENSSQEQNEINSVESNSDSSEAKQTNGSTSSEGEIKHEVSKKRPFSNLESIDTSEPECETNDSVKDENESKRKKLDNENELEKEDKIEEAPKEEIVEDAKMVEDDVKEHIGDKIDLNIDSAASASNQLQTKNEDSNHSIKEVTKEEMTEDFKETVVNEPELEKVDQISVPPEHDVEEKDESLVPKVNERNAEDTVDCAEKDKVDDSLLSNMKVESPTSPKSPQDLSVLSSRDREKRPENVPLTGLSVSSLTITTPTTSSSIIKKEDNAAINFSTTPTSKVSPSSSPNPMLFPFSQSFSQIAPSLPTSTSMADRFPYLMPPINFSPGVGMTQDNVSSSPKLASAATSNEKLESELRHKEEFKSIEVSIAKSTASSKSESSRSLQSPKTISTSAPSFPTLAFSSAPNDPFLLANPNFAASHLAAGGERLPFSNPLINYPPGFAPHLSGLPSFMNPWSQYAAARLPPGAFPSPYLQPSPGPMGSHSPHSQISKSKSPITSQSSTHHNSPSHFSSHSSKTHENRDSLERRERDLYQQDEEDMDNSFLPRGPSPEPKIEDSECHRSQSAIFLRHWNRGDFNSCARTDLTFKPVPDSSLSRKREERARKAAEKEREDHNHTKKSEKVVSLDLKPSSGHGASQSNSSHENNAHLISPLGGRHTPRNFDTPAMRQLSEYARPHATYSPFSHPQIAHHMAPSNIPPLGLHPQNPAGASPIDPLTLAQYQMYKDVDEKQKLAIMEKQKEIELKSRSASQVVAHSSSMPPTSSANSLFDQHFLEMQKRLSSGQGPLSNSPSMSNNPNALSTNGLPLAAPPGTPLNPFLPIFSPNERTAQEQMQHMAAAVAAADRQYQAERLASLDPLFRLQMSINSELHGAAGAHPFQHPSHSVHPGAHQPGNSSAESAAAASMQLASAAVAMGLPASQFDPALHASHSLLQSAAYPSRPPSIMPRPELAQQSSLYRSFEDQLSQQITAQAQAIQHEQMQRQMMMERERMMHFAAAAASSQVPHQQFQLQEEYLRQQREREMKLRSFEDAARNGRPM